MRQFLPCLLDGNLDVKERNEQLGKTPEERIVSFRKVFTVWRCGVTVHEKSPATDPNSVGNKVKRTCMILVQEICEFVFSSPVDSFWPNNS